MTEQEINMAIAEACGWRVVDAHKNLSLPRALECWTNDKGHLRYGTELPSYTSDLNAMHEAAATALTSQELRDLYSIRLAYLLPRAPNEGPGEEELVTIIPSQWAIHEATASQRAEAFLRTLGLWMEE